MRSRRIALGVALGVVAIVSPPHVAAVPKSVGATEVFAPVGSPGTPEGISVVGKRVFVGTNAPVYGNQGAGPSKVFVYDIDTGEQLLEHVVTGQNLDDIHGVVGMAPGDDGVVYVADRSPARVLRIDTSTTPPTQTTYATLPDLAPCAVGTVPTPAAACSPTSTDLPAYPDGIVFDEDGNLYVSDFQQAAIFKVGPGGGAMQVWFADPRLESTFGPNGLAFDAHHDTLYVAVTGAMRDPAPAKGVIYTLPRKAQVTATDLRTFFVYPEPAAGPDGIAFGKSGRLYVALAGLNAVSVLSPLGTEVVRFPDAVSNARQSVPYDMPASIAFDNATRTILITNHTYFTGNQAHAVVFRAFVDDTALPLSKP